MGRKIYDEDLRLNLILNGEGLNNGSKKLVAELGKMEQEMVKMEQQAKVLAASIKNLEKNATANATQLKLEKAQYSQLTQAMKAHELSIESMRKQVGLAGMTVGQLRNHLNALKVQLFNMPGSAGTSIFKKLQAEITETNIRLTTLTTGASRMAQAWSRLEQTINKAGTIVGWVAVGVYAITRLVSGVVSRMKDLEDLVGSVRKNTNLVVGEVWDMKDAFDKWDTRTKTDDLLQMAVVAGKLGIDGKENIMDFVDSANKIQIALGDDLNGSVEDTVNSIGKLTNAFRILDEVDTKTGKKFTLGAAMIRTGDVLNQLAKSSAASAGTILEYMTRLAGVSELAHFSIAQIGGLGSVLDALNVPSERGATALQKIMLQLANPKKIQDFAEALGTTAEGYKQMLANDPNKVLTELLRKFVSTKSGLVELTGGLKDFGVRGQYMTAVLGSLAQNLDVLAEQQGIAGKAWQDGTSVLSEYNIMNNNFTADVLKQQKIIRAQTDHFNREAEPAVVGMITAWARFIVAIRETTDWIGKHWTAVKALTFAFIALNAPMLYRISLLIAEKVAEQASLVWTRLRIFWMQAEIIWTRNLTATQIVLMNQSKFLTIANIALTRGIRAAWTEMMVMIGAAEGLAFPITALVAVVGLLAGAFYFLVIRQKELTEIEKAYQQLQKDIATDYGKQKATLDVLMGRLKDINISEQERTDILKKIKDEYGQYLPLLEKEGLTAKDVADSYDLIVDAMARKITYEKTFDAQVANRVKMQEAQTKIDKLKAEMAASPQKSSVPLRDGEQDIIAAKYAGMEFALTKLEKIQREYVLADAKFNADIQANAPKSKQVIVNGKLVTPESDETFKQRQAKRDSEFKEEEVLIKEQYAKKAGMQDEMNAKLKASNLAYLNATIKDYEDSNRTEGESASAYWAAREKRADLMIGDEKKKKKEQKEVLLELENKYGTDQAKIKNRYLKREIETEDEYNDELLILELNFLADKMKLYKVGSKEYLDAYNELLSKKISVEKSIEDKIATVQKQYAKIKIERLGNDIDKAIAIENDRWNEERKQLENELNTKKELNEKEFEYNWIINKIIEAKALEHQEKLRKINSIADESEINRLKNSLNALTQIGNMTNWLNNQQLKGFYQKKTDLIKQQYEKEKLLAGDNQQLLNQADQNYAQQNFDLKKEMFDAEMKMNQAKIQMIQSYISALRNIVGEQSDIGRALFLLSQGVAIADVWIKTAATNAIIYSTALAANAILGPAAPLAAAAWAAAPIAANNANAAWNTGLILAQTIGEVAQWAEGNYPVIGRDDGRYYNAIDGGSPRTGIYGQPTLLNMSSGRSLVGERAPELVVDGDTFRRIQINAPQLLREIYAYAGRSGQSGPVRQMAEGSYPTPSLPVPASPSVSSAETNAINRALAAELRLLRTNGIRAYFNKYGTNSLAEAQDDIAKFKAKVNKK